MIEVNTEFEGRNISLESGKFAKQASGSVMVKSGDTMVLVTAVAAADASPNLDFLPLQVEYREKTAAAGKIPGGFMKREGRPSDHEVLCSRLIDRPTRPLIPKSWRYETQIIATVFSSEPDNDPDTLAALGASAALLISDIPFAGPFSEVRVGRIEGRFVINPSFDMLEHSELDLTVAGTNTAITMVEGESKEISEVIFLEALEFAHEKIKELNNLQIRLAEQIKSEKREFEEKEIPEDFVQAIESAVKDLIHDYVYSDTTKQERREKRTVIKEKALEAATEKFSEDEEYEGLVEKYAAEVVGKLEKAEMRTMILSERRRLDGRKLDEIRQITCEVGLLPRAHGSALFTRGETQSLTTVTLGTKRDEQMVDGLLPMYTNNFFLHYNFPPYSTGEVKRLGVSRREIGHGNLAERAIKPLIPNGDDFPYVMRIVSDILESNGSSSMATVCAGSLALFDAGVPMEKPCAGIAMGLIHEENNFAVLSDILGDEDALGDMDFKVTGTVDGITACQMDIKIEGLSIEIMKLALEQARIGRLHILEIMNESIIAPREDVSRHAPRFTKMHVPTDMIGTVIGPGGETIRGIVKETGAEINIDDDGTVTIAAVTKESADEARRIIEQLTVEPEEGEIYNGTIKELRDGLGAFVEILPKKQGLLHISQIAWERVEDLNKHLKVGDKIDVKLLEITRDGKYRLSRKALLEKPDGYVEPERSERPPRRDNRDGGRRDSRGGGRDRDRGDRGDRGRGGYNR